MARARSEEDRDIARPRTPRHARLTVAHAVVPQDSLDLGGHSCCARVRVIGDRKTQRRLMMPMKGVRRRKAIGVVVGEVVRLDRGLRRDFREQIVDELEQLGYGPEASGDGPSGGSGWTKGFDMPRRLVKNGDLCVAEAVNGLFAIADDEN